MKEARRNRKTEQGLSRTENAKTVKIANIQKVSYYTDSYQKMET